MLFDLPPTNLEVRKLFHVPTHLVSQFVYTCCYLLETIGNALANHHYEHVHVVPDKGAQAIDNLKNKSIFKESYWENFLKIK